MSTPRFCTPLCPERHTYLEIQISLPTRSPIKTQGWPWFTCVASCGVDAAAWDVADCPGLMRPAGCWPGAWEFGNIKWDWCSWVNFCRVFYSQCFPCVAFDWLIDSLEKNIMIIMCMDIQRREASTLWCGGPLRKHRAFGGVLRTIWSGRQLWCGEWLDTGSLDTALCLKTWALSFVPLSLCNSKIFGGSECMSLLRSSFTPFKGSFFSALAAFSPLQLCRCCEPVWPTSSDGS